MPDRTASADGNAAAGPAGAGHAVDAAIRPVTLRFVDPALERRFAAETAARSLPLLRGGLAGAAVLYALFGLLDGMIAPAQLTSLLLIRFGVIVPGLLAAMAATFVRAPFVRLHLILALALLGAGLGIVAMTAILPQPGSHLYYAGLIVSVVYGSVLMPLHYRALAAVSAVLFAAYQAAALVVNPIPPWMLVSNDIFLLSTIAIAGLGRYLAERAARRDFVQACLLRRETERSAALLDAATAASRAKSEFLATMSHELRTPLNAVIGFSDMLRQEVLGPLGGERYRGYADDIHASGRHLLSIVNDVLDLSKAEAGRMTLAEETVELGEVVEEGLRLFRGKAADGVRLSFDRPAGPVRLLADARLVKQVAINLVSNAVKFTRPGGAVTVSILPAEDGGCDLVVADTGVGIGPEHLARVLEPFVQVEDAYSRTRQGTGLGLPLVKRILELHGGTLLLRSAPGVGTTAIARFPATRRLGPASPAHRSSAA